MDRLIDKARRVFAEAPRPEHFTDYTHCCECSEHDETLRAHTPDSIGLEELGNPGWDPMCFATNDAFKYYFPALVRLALGGTGVSYYVDQFLFHIIEDGPRNRRWEAFTRPQRELVLNVLEALLEHKSVEIERSYDADRLIQAIEIWSDTDR